MADTYNADDEVRQFKTWLRENGLSLVAGLGVGLAIVLGWQGWQAYDKHRSEQASQRYGQVQMAVRANNLASAESYTRELREDYKATPYAALASLQLAGAYARNSQMPQADEHLNWVVDYAADNKIRSLARLRRARLLWAQGDAAQALAFLDEQEAPDAMQPLFAELRGDLLTALDRNDEARQAYQLARDGYINPAERALVEQKLDDLATAANAGGNDKAGEGEA